jgi:hypothetical protein
LALFRWSPRNWSFVAKGKVKSIEAEHIVKEPEGLISNSSSFAPAFRDVLIEAITQENLTTHGSETLIEMLPLEAGRSRVDKSLVEDVTLALMIRDGAVEVTGVNSLSDVDQTIALALKFIQ